MLDSASLTKGGKAIASNVQLKKVDGAGSLYQLDFMALKPSAGCIDSVVTYTSIRLFYAVLRIHDILVWIRIRIWIRGSI